MKKFIIPSAILCIILMQNFVFAVEKDVQHEKYIESLLKDKPASYYKMEINPITPSTGVTTGHVIAYGHYIKPPYKVEVRDTCVFINNVQVHPILLTPEMKKEKKELLRRGKKELKTNKNLIAVNNARALYDSLLQINISPLEAMAQVVEYLHKHRDFKDSIISYDSRLIYVRYRKFFGKKEVEGWQKCIGFDKVPNSSGSMPSPEKMTMQFEQSIIESLRKGVVEIISPPGSHAGRYENDLLKIRNLLLNNNISKKDKLTLMEEMVGSANALMLLNNYNKHEWQ